MPEFVQQDAQPVQKIVMNFASLDDVAKFAKLIGQKLTANTRSIWYPEVGEDRYMDKRYTSTKK